MVWDLANRVAVSNTHVIATVINTSHISKSTDTFLTLLSCYQSNGWNHSIWNWFEPPRFWKFHVALYRIFLRYTFDISIQFLHNSQFQKRILFYRQSVIQFYLPSLGRLICRHVHMGKRSRMQSSSLPHWTTFCNIILYILHSLCFTKYWRNGSQYTYGFLYRMETSLTQSY